jgi:hypothetical protein
MTVGRLLAQDAVLLSSVTSPMLPVYARHFRSCRGPSVLVAFFESTL